MEIDERILEIMKILQKKGLPEFGLIEIIMNHGIPSIKFMERIKLSNCVKIKNK